MNLNQLEAKLLSNALESATAQMVPIGELRGLFELIDSLKEDFEGEKKFKLTTFQERHIEAIFTNPKLVISPTRHALTLLEKVVPKKK